MKEEIISPGAEEDAGNGSVSFASDPRRERVLLRKLDLHLIPLIMLLYLFSFLDRGMWFALSSAYNSVRAANHSSVNIGNARLYGLEKDLGLKGNQYQVSVSILFVTYCVRGLIHHLHWCLKLIIYHSCSRSHRI